VAHNPVGGALVGAAAGFEAGGLPGAAVSLVVSTISAFRKPSRPPLFPPFRMDLWRRFQEGFRPHFRAIGRASIEHQESIKEFGIATPARNFLPPAQDRRGLLIINEVFFTLTNERAQNLLNSLAAGQIQITNGRFETTLPTIEQDTPDPETLATPSGGKPMVAKINRGNFNEGMGNELETNLTNFELGSLVNPVLDIARFLPREDISGPADQHFTDQTVVASTNSTGLRISADTAKGRKIYIRRGHLTLSPNGPSVPEYHIVAGSAIKGVDIPVTKMHFEVLRQSSSLGLGSAVLDLEFGEFTPRQGEDYLIRILNGVGATIRWSGCVEAFFLPIGVNGSKC